jgi:glycolate oxidase
MPLKREIYRAFKDIVGEANITADPAIIDSYALGWQRPGFVERFDAILLPKDTAEIQTIVKLCNKHNIMFKASSTGFGLWNDPATTGVIKLDLKRMNRIIEINEKSMYAVVEPYVISAQLQAELMKRGLNFNIIGAGSNTSALPFTAHAGIGHMGETTSYRERNILGVEWVTPEGEIVRLGSLGSLGEWFCGDGPGPSLRGIIMGAVSPLGGLGIFTRAATKVYPWPGPAAFPIEGVSPHYVPSEIPPNFFYRYYSFPSVDDMIEAQRKIGESEIAFEVMGFNIAMLSANMATDNIEDNKYLEIFRKHTQGRGFQVILAGNSPDDFEYKKLVLEQIIRETHGKSLEILEDPKIAGGFIWRNIRVTASIRECFRIKGTRQHSAFLGGSQIYSKEVRLMEELSKIKQKLIDEGLVRDDTAGYISWSHEHGHLGHGEMLFQLNDESPEAMKAKAELRGKGCEIALKTNYGVPSQANGDALHDMFGPHACNYHSWLRKIKKTFDPKGLSDAFQYISAKE